ncbi:MAG TPA: serine hydrolase domain-containing protein [Candidatus Dormibacteraeota bacterium]
MGVDTARVDALFSDWDRDDAPGCALAIIEAGEIAYARGYGQADLERPTPITPASVFDIGSTSKQFTAASVLLLAREGRLSLDDDIHKFLPQLPDLGPISVRQLVHHTSGIRDYLNLTLIAGRTLDNDQTEDEVLDRIARQRGLDFQPGSKHSYSNSGYFLLGEIVRSVSGSSLREFAAERILKPLGMTRTFFHDDYGELVAGRALGYSPAGDGSYRLDNPIWDVTGDGAVYTTVEDLRHWDRQFYECSLPGGADFIREMTTPGRLSGGEELEYAFGLSIGTHRGARTISHGGSWGGYRAEMLRFPDHRTTIVVLANRADADASGLAYQVAGIVLGDRLEPAPPDESDASEGRPADLAGLVGVYTDDERTLVVSVEAIGVRVFGQQFELVEVAPGKLRFKGLPIAVEVAGPGELRLEVGGEERWTLRRLPAGAPDWSRLSGRYRSSELDVEYQIALVEDEPRLRRGWQPWEPLAVAGADVLGFSHGVISLREGGFTVNTGRARGIEFERL